MFLTLNGVIRTMILFLIIEVLFLSVKSLVNKNEKKEFHFVQTASSSSPPLIEKELELLAFSDLPLSPQATTTKDVSKTKSAFRLIALKNSNDVVALKSQNVEPICYINTIALDSLSIQEKKATFINIILPSILLAKYKMQMERKKLFRLSKKETISPKDRLWIENKKVDFKAKDIDELYNKMEVHPTSLIIAQAIVESGWGTSKFFKKANNVFGIWSFSIEDERIVASEKRGKKSIYLKKYSTIHQSIYDYLVTISSVSSYESFQEKRLETQDPFVLVEHLGKYSERGKSYIADIKNIIKTNRLIEYDSYKLNL